MERKSSFPIAITGFGIRFPGNVHDEESFWNLICNGGDGIVDIPRDRWDVDRFYDPDPDKPGKMYVKKGGFLQTPIDEFDALFFGITPREAACMDPQQRLLLQVVWEALHNAGIVPEELAGTNTGVYVGAFTLDNLLHQMGPLARDLIGAHTAVGSTMTILSNRISYLLDLRGPSLSMDTACSSSLVAVHHACQAIWSGHCNLALVGGVNVMFRPEYLIAMCKGKFLAKDGYCKSFDARADGYARGEGAGAIVLKPLAKAQRDGDIIHGIIRATGVNQDGRSNGITSPNRESQVALIREVHAQAGIEPAHISYVEAHGTGTQAGDTAETHALGEAIGRLREKDKPLPVGSVKANIGHLEAASGIAGLVKSMLCLKHQQIPPIANLQTPNPDIPFAELGIHLPRATEPMSKAGDVAYAALNSFGYGGTNAHVLLQEVPAGLRAQNASAPSAIPSSESKHYLLALSAKDPQALIELARRHQRAIENNPALDLTDYCYSCAVRRGHYQHRVAIVARDREQLLQQLNEFTQYQMGASLRSGEASGEPPQPVFVFTGMGPQWWAMGRELLLAEPVFRDEAQRCDKAFERVSGWSILEQMLADESASNMASTTVAQPANFVLQAALAALWKSRGIHPAAIVGHSVGEVTAAYVAGVLTLEEAALVSYHRSRIQSKAAGLGGMLAVGLSEKEARALLAGYSDAKVDIAAVNGPDSLTLSGDLEVLQTIAAQLDERSVFQRALQVEVAYHSPYMDPLLPEMRAALAALNPQQPHTPLYSTVTGARMEAGQYGAEYWCRNARQAVLFAPAMQAILKAGHTLFLEVGPHPVLSTSIKQCAAAAGKTIAGVASLNRKTAEAETFNLATAELYAAGCAINWRSLFPQHCRYVQLPAYPWQNTRYWLESDSSRHDRLASPDHPLLGLRQSSPEPLWSSRLNGQTLPYLHDHCVEDLVVLPGAAYVELGLAAHKALQQQEQWVIEDLSFFNALLVSGDDEPELQTRYRAADNSFAIHSKSRAADQWQAHASGRFSLLPPLQPAALPLEKILAAMETGQTKCEHYINMSAKKLQYGPCFQGVEQMWQGRDEAGRVCLAAKVTAPETVRAERERYCLHPAILDACFQSLLTVLPVQDKRAFVPTHIRQIRYHAEVPDVVYCYGIVDSLASEALVGDLIVCDETGRVLVELFGIRARSLSGTERLSTRDLDDWLYDIDWQPLETPLIATSGRWIIAGDLDRPQSLAAQVRQQLLDAGNEVVAVSYAAEFSSAGENRYTLDPSSREDFTRLAQASAHLPCAGFLFFPPDAGDDSPINDSKTLSALAAIQGITGAETDHVRQLCFVTRCAQPTGIDPRRLQLDETGIVALLRVAANEYPEYHLRSLDIDAHTSARQLALVIRGACNENEVALRGERRLAMRMVRRTAQSVQSQCDALAQGGETFVIDTDFDAGAEGQPGAALTHAEFAAQEPGAVKLAVHASTTLESDLTAKRLAAAAANNYGLTARLHLCELVSGETARSAEQGNKVLVLSKKPLASHIIACEKDLLLPREAQWVTAENLGAVLALLAAYRALVDVACIKAGQSVLIHAADTPIGMAAVDIALSRRASIYVTLQASENAGDLLGRGVQACFSSHTLDFSEQILRHTQQRGVDIVLNPFAGEIAAHSVKLVKTGGCLLNFSGLETELALRIKAGISLHTLSMDDLLLNAPAQLNIALNCVCRGLEQGTYSAAPATLIGIGELKTVADMPPANTPFTLRIDPAPDAALFKAGAMSIDKNATYLVTGGFGGFGQAITRHLARRGARHLIIASRSGARSAADAALLSELQAQGVDARAVRVDVADADQVAELFANTLSAMPPLKGIVHTAGVLDDSPVNFVARENLARVMGPKVRGAWNLHQQSLASPLDFFVLFSSIASMIGAAGQASYVIANVWLDNFAHLRRAQGLPAVSISWGALGEVGMAAVDPDVVAYFERVGLRPISPVKAVESFAKLLDWQRPHLGLVDMDWGLWGSYYPAWAKSPRYAHLVPEKSAGEQQSQSWIQAWLAQSEQTQLEEVLRRLIAIVARCMKLPAEKISAGNNLPRLGIDSLIAMELQTVIQQELNVRISTLELMKGNSLQQMAVHIRGKYLEDMEPGAEAGSENERSTGNAVIDDLDDEQLEHILSEMMA